MKRLLMIVLMMNAVLLAGCNDKPANKMLPKASVVDAEYSKTTSDYLNNVLATPKAKTVDFTYWHEAKRSYGGLASLKVDSKELVAAIENAGGFEFSQAKGFRFVYDEAKGWKAYVATSDTTQEAHPADFYIDAVKFMKKANL